MTIGRIIGAVILIALFVAIVVVLAKQVFYTNPVTRHMISYAYYFGIRSYTPQYRIGMRAYESGFPRTPSLSAARGISERSILLRVLSRGNLSS